MIALWHTARARLEHQRRSAAVLGAANTVTAVICLLSGSVIWRMLSASVLAESRLFSGAVAVSDLLLPCWLIAVCAATTPLRIQTAWQLGRISGTLDENDLGFLQCSAQMWLWLRALCVRLLGGLLLLLACLPAYLLAGTARCLWLLMPDTGEQLLPLLTVLHLSIAAAAALWLPLRAASANTALFYCFLKMPHTSCVHIIRSAYRATRHKTAETVVMRLFAAPLLLIPFSAVTVLPRLYTAEMLRAEQGLQMPSAVRCVPMYVPAKTIRFARQSR